MSLCVCSLVLQMPVPEQLGTLITALWKEHGWALCHLQRAAAKQKGALGQEHICSVCNL